MQRLFVGNFEFEHCLANPDYQANASILRLNAELATSWLAIADDGDILWCPESIAPEFFDRLHAQGLPRMLPISQLSSLPSDIELFPWGWSADWLRRAEQSHWSFSAADPAVIRMVNARQFSYQWEQQWDVGLQGTSTAIAADQIDKAYSTAARQSSRVVIKANWGMAGRERLVVTGPLTDSHRTWLRKRLNAQGIVFFEPWVELVEELGIQLEIPRSGPPTLIGTSTLVCGPAGQYRGNWCTVPDDSGDEFSRRWQPAVDVAFSAAERMQSLGYFGPVGIDATRYRRADGSIGIRPLQDINARWTMGRLGFGWQRLLQPGERAFWQHGPPADVDSLFPTGMRPRRVIDTSPAEIGGQPVIHRTRLWTF